MVLVGWYTNKENEKQWNELQKLTNYMNDIFYGFSTLAIFKRLHKQDKTLQSASNQYRLSLLKVLRISFLSAFVLEIAATLSVALIAVSIGIRLVNGNIELGSGLLILILAPEVYLPLRALGANYHAAAEGLGATNQIFEFLETETAIKSNPQKIRNIEIMEVTELSVKFDEITAINNLNFSAHPGEITALVGPSGSGKTTLINCLLGFVFTEKGNISFVSDEKKFNITEIDIEDLRKNVSLLSQFPLLFPGTVNFNVALADPTKTKEEIDEVLNKVGIGYLSKQLINSNGEGVSTGEKRRIGLARVILNPKPIILLDEPTASLDEISEKIVLEHIKQLANKSIVIAATHHDALIEISGKIIEISTERLSPLDGLRI
jgi:ATP-binding cassette subfamily C protein CydCD